MHNYNKLTAMLLIYIGGPFLNIVAYALVFLMPRTAIISWEVALVGAFSAMCCICTALAGATRRHIAIRETRYLALAFGVIWFLGLYSPGLGQNPQIGLLWSTLERGLIGMFKHPNLLSQFDWLALGLSALAFLICCWGIGGLKALRGLSRNTRTSGSHKGINLPKEYWAAPADVKKHFSAAGGIVLGELTHPLHDTPDFDERLPKTWGRQGKGALITMSPKTGNGHVLMCAESAGFKTSGIVIPNILTYRGPVVVLDPKGDLYARTAPARRKMGFNPIKVSARDGLDPFRILAPLIKNQPSVFLSLAKTIIPAGAGATENSNHWRDRSVGLLAALLCHYISGNCTNVPLAITSFLSLSKEAAVKEASKIAKKSKQDFVRNQLSRLQAQDDKSYVSLIEGITNKFSFGEFEDIRNFVVDPKGSEKHKIALKPDTDIYINIPSSVLMDFAPMIRLLLASMLTAARLTEQPENPRARRLFILDEAKGLGNMDILELVRDEGRAIGLHLMMMYQSWGQMVKIWGHGGADAWVDSTSVRIFSAAQSAARARELSNILGKHTVSVKTQSDTTSNAKYQLFSGQTSAGQSEQIREIPLLTQTEISQLPLHSSLIFTRKTKPILASKAIYFTRKDMNKRVREVDAVRDELDLVECAPDESAATDAAESPEDSPDEVISRSELEEMAHKSTDVTALNKLNKLIRNELDPDASIADFRPEDRIVLGSYYERARRRAGTSADLRPGDMKILGSLYEAAKLRAGTSPDAKPDIAGVTADDLKVDEQPKSIPSENEPATAPAIEDAPEPPVSRKQRRWSLPSPSALWRGAKRNLLLDTDTVYESLDGLGPVSIFQSREAYGLDGDPVSVAIAPDRLVSDALYTPAKNGRWLPYVDAPHPMEDAEPADILDYDNLALRPLVFDHLCPPDLPGIIGQGTGGDDGDWFDRDGFRVLVRLHAVANALLRHRQELRFGKPVEMFLNHYPGIPNNKAWLVRATFLGAHLPYKYWPSCVWEDRISADQPGRLFRQVVTVDGLPVGAAQSWPITDFARRNGNITKLNML